MTVIFHGGNGVQCCCPNATSSAGKVTGWASWCPIHGSRPPHPQPNSKREARRLRKRALKLLQGGKA